MRGQEEEGAPDSRGGPVWALSDRIYALSDLLEEMQVELLDINLHLFKDTGEPDLENLKAFEERVGVLEKRLHA